MQSAFVVPGAVPLAWTDKSRGYRVPSCNPDSGGLHEDRKHLSISRSWHRASRSVDRSGCGVVSARQPYVTDCPARTRAVDALAIASSALEGSRGVIAGRGDGASLSMPVQFGMAWKAWEGSTQRFVRVLSDQAPIIPLVSANATMCDLFLVRVFSRMWSIWRSTVRGAISSFLAISFAESPSATDCRTCNSLAVSHSVGASRSFMICPVLEQKKRSEALRGAPRDEANAVLPSARHPQSFRPARLGRLETSRTYLTYVKNIRW